MMSEGAEEKFKKDNPVAHAAWELAQVYENNRNEEGSLTEIGFMHMTDRFGRVPEELRGDVFIMFLSQLDEKGIEYNVREFMVEGEVH